jgi:MFS family permease
MRLALIVLSQFLSGSIWFAGNIAFQGQSILLSAVQLGFIIGTLLFAFFNISDRFSPVRVFFVCSCLGALCNGSGVFLGESLPLLLITRVLCGLSLAGIYPVGMKIAASWYPKTVASALGWLVGALVLASGLPHLIGALNWQGDAGFILAVTSALCFAGGTILILFVGDGPHFPMGARFDIRVLGNCFRNKEFRAASFGYFGHMWELYAVYAYVPLLIASIGLNPVHLWSFGFFVSGFIGCSVGGMIALKTGSRAVALTALFTSGSICLVSPLLDMLPAWIALVFVILWGMSVAADSPQFSSLNTRFAPRHYIGSALTIVNCIGFLITIVTIELLDLWIDRFGVRTAFLLLAIGPFFGWISLSKLKD